MLPHRSLRRHPLALALAQASRSAAEIKEGEETKGIVIRVEDWLALEEEIHRALADPNLTPRQAMQVLSEITEELEIHHV